MQSPLRVGGQTASLDSDPLLVGLVEPATAETGG